MNNPTAWTRAGLSSRSAIALLLGLLMVAGCSDSNDDDTSDNTAEPTTADDDPSAETDAPAVGGDGEGQTAEDDYSPTATESASLVGPYARDPERGAGPPSAPADLTALMTSYDWVEFSWVPSVDDDSVVAYEIYRNGELIHTLQDTEAEKMQWLTTTWMDCNYTKNAECVTTQPTAGSTNDYYVIAVDGEGQQSPPSDTVSLPLLTTTTSTVDTADYSLVFEDEFEGDRLDREKWRTSLPWGPDTTINGETQYFADIFGNDPIAHDPFVFNGETLTIQGTETPPELLDAANGQPYLSGVISSLDRFALTYGYIEMSARMATGTGMLSTFYLFNDDYERNKPEIDIAEYNGGEPTTTTQTYHYFDSNKSRDYRGEKHSSPTMLVENGPVYSDDFHTYSVLWEPELAIWYIDGVEVQRIAGPRISDEPMHIVSHLVVGSTWIGAPDASTVFPGELEIDYIRAWELP